MIFKSIIFLHSEFIILNNNNSNNNIMKTVWRTSRLFLLCRRFCAPVYSVFFAVCYFCTFPKCCDEKDRDCPAGTLRTIQPILPSFPKKKKKNLNISWYQLWPQWLYYYYYCMTHSFTEKTICGMYRHSFLYCFVCLFVQFLFCQSVPKHKHRHVFLCHWNPVIDNLIW